jgi:hypothetical protein
MGLLSIRTGPFHWTKNRDQNLFDIDQIFVAKSIRRNRLLSVPSTASIPSTVVNDTRYLVNAHLSGGLPGSVVTLLRLDDYQEALFIEQQIEQYLGITDRPMEGEYPYHPTPD